MLRTWWAARAAYGLRWRTGLRWTMCWEIADSMADHYRPDGMSPTDAVRDELSYWGAAQ